MLDEFTKEELAEAQEKLNKLCQANKIKPFDLKSRADVVAWRKLVLAQCGVIVKPKKRGRKPYVPEQVKEVGRSIEAAKDFPPLDNTIHNAAYLNRITLILQGISESRGISFDAARGMYDEYKKKYKPTSDTMSEDFFDEDFINDVKECPYWDETDD